jgi:large repetitive protein
VDRYPNYYVDWPDAEGRAIQWHTYDALTADQRLTGQVQLELYRAGLGKVADIATVPAVDGSYGWSPQASGIVPSTVDRYWIRVTSLDDPTVLDESRERFSVPVAGPNYYVNDGSTANDEYSTAVGNNRNSGKTPGDPKANLLPLLRTYDLGPGDVVRIDTGNYIHVRNVVISGNLTSGNDEGARFTGPTDPAKVATIDRANTSPGSTNIEVVQADYVTREHLTLTGAEMGVWVHNASTHFAGRHLILANNRQDGIRLESDASGSALDYLTAFNNQRTGIAINTAIGQLAHSEAHHNGTDISISGWGSPTIVGSSNLSAGAGNKVYENTDTGIYASGDVTVVGNAVWGQSGSNGTGIRTGSSVVVSQNVVHHNRSGISGSSSTIEGNRVYQNMDRGIILAGAGTVRGNVVYGNATAIAGQPGYYTFGGQVLNNLVYGNADRGIQITSGSGAQVVNNTVYQEAGDAIRLEGNHTNGVALRNNILWVPWLGRLPRY